MLKQVENVCGKEDRLIRSHEDLLDKLNDMMIDFQDRSFNAGAKAQMAEDARVIVEFITRDAELTGYSRHFTPEEYESIKKLAGE
jgi:hypothetical protein